MNNPNLKKFYQNSAKPVNYLPNFLVDGSPQYAPTMSGLMLINPTTKDIWVSAGKEFVSDWINIVGGGGGGAVTSVVQGPGISISSTGPGGTGVVTVSSSLTPQGLQDVIIEDNKLTQDNIIIGTDTSIEWNSNNYFEINPAASYPGGNGYFRAGVGKFPPSYCELYVEALYAQMFGQGTTNQIVKVDSIGVYIQTPAVANGTATAGQVLTLGNPITGAVEYTTLPPSPTVLFLEADQTINVGTGYNPINDITIPIIAGKSYSFKATILYNVPTGSTEVSWRIGGVGSVSFDSGIAIWEGNVKNINSINPTIYAVASYPGATLATVEGLLNNVQANDNFFIGVSFQDALVPATSATILQGSTLVYYEI